MVKKNRDSLKLEPCTNLTRPGISNSVISWGRPSMISKQSQYPSIPFPTFHGLDSGNSAFELLENLFLMMTFYELGYEPAHLPTDASLFLF